MADNPKPEQSDALHRQDLESGLRFLHSLGMQTKVDLVAVSSRVLALIEELVASRTLDLRSFEARRELVAQREAERMSREGHVRVLVDDTEDKYSLTDLPQIDCAARIPICRARCCSFSFALSFQDLNERVVQWDYSIPYHVRQGENGYCVHNDRQTHVCGVYDHRPAVCRNYDCRGDTRIWKDFDKCIPAEPPSGGGATAGLAA